MQQETGMNASKYLAIVISIALILAGCGKEGPFGNTPGPKKPEQRAAPSGELSR
jgi:predicted small lipoprotein YifL